MKSIPVTFKNKPMPDGTVVTFTMKGCLVANTGSPTAAKPTIQIHLPKTDNRDINGAFVEYAGHDYHVVDTTAAQMDPNTPTPWNRYAIAERIRML